MMIGRQFFIAGATALTVISKRQMGLAMPTALSSGRLEVWYGPLIDAMARHGITTPERIDEFLANVAEETGELQAREENLHYTAGQLKALFPSIFDSRPGLAEQISALGPEAVANVIYADAYRALNYRMGNRDPGDGWKYRGRGPMQLTGRNNYEQFFRAAGLPIDSDPDLLLEPKWGAESAAHFWQVAGCNELADTGNFDGAVVRVNGGTINLATRRLYNNRFHAAMANPDPPVPGPQTFKENIKPPLPEAPPPVTMDELKPKPQLEPVPPPPPVPPPGFSVQPGGNVVIDDIKQSKIVQGANVGQVVTGTAATVTAAAGAAASVKGLLPEHLTDTAIICLTVIVLALLAGISWYFHRVKAERIAMNKQGIA